jgi:NAD(P)-dependent dehydrogenase (short-subunit alcohol dehydrogenase family)
VRTGVPGPDSSRHCENGARRRSTSKQHGRLRRGPNPAVRDPESLVPGDRVVPFRPDVTNPADIAEAAARATDTTILINNAGSNTGASLLDGDLADLRLELETHLIGSLTMIRAFAPALERSGGAVLNVLSVRSLLTNAEGAYATAKAAAWAMTNTVRLAFAQRGVLVTALHVGFMDTDMTASISEPTSDPATIADTALRRPGGRNVRGPRRRDEPYGPEQALPPLHELYPELARDAWQ